MRVELELIRASRPRGSSQGLEAFHRLVAAYAAAGRRIDELRRYEPDETVRFYDYTLQGANGHVFWSTKSPFRLNDGRTRKPVLFWWQHLYGRTPDGVEMICGEPRCINPRHGKEVPRGPKRIYPEHVIIGALQVWALRHGESPSSRVWDGAPSHQVIKKRFGSWEAALKAAGLAPVQRNKLVSTETVLDAYRLVESLVGHPPSYDEFRAHRSELKAHGFPTSPTTLRRRFGSWAGVACEAAR